MRKLFAIASVLAVVIFGLVPAFAQDEDTIVDIAVASEDFETLVQAVQAAGLVEALSSPGPFTVFAPTDEAFAAALDSLGLTAEELLADTAMLTDILLYHVVPAELMAADVVSAIEAGGGTATVPTLQGSNLEVTLGEDGPVINGTVNVAVTDVDASNGVIHVIDGVLLPPATEEMDDMTEVPMTHIRVHHFSPDTPAVDVYVNGEVAISGLEFPNSTGWVDLAAGVYEIAVAPAGTSIEDAAIGPAEFELSVDNWINIAAVGSLEEGTLAPAIFVENMSAELAEENARVTVFHGIEGAPAVDVLAGGEVIIPDLNFPGTLNGNDGAFTIDAPAGTYDLSVVVDDTDTQILDLSGTTLEAGMIYLVAAVGTPDAPQAAVAVVAASDIMMDEMTEDTMATEQSITDVVASSATSDTPEFTILLQAVQAAGLGETLASEGPFTVFAPTDAAFAAALDQLGLTAEELLSDTELLTNVLLYHVVPAELMAADVIAAVEGAGGTASVGTAQGSNIEVTLGENGPVINDTVNVISTDISATNGVIHVIDAVLLPPTE